MTRLFLFSLAGVLALSSAALADDAEARKISEKVTTDGAAIFDTFDARAIAATYDESAILNVLKNENGEIQRETHQGRREIEAFYTEIFKSPQTVKSRNVVEYAKLLKPGLLSIDGTFDMNTLEPNSIKVPFHQLRHKKDGKWLILSMEIPVATQN